MDGARPKGFWCFTGRCEESFCRLRAKVDEGNLFITKAARHGERQVHANKITDKIIEGEVGYTS